MNSRIVTFAVGPLFPYDEYFLSFEDDSASVDYNAPEMYPAEDSYDAVKLFNIAATISDQSPPAPGPLPQSQIPPSRASTSIAPSANDTPSSSPQASQTASAPMETMASSVSAFPLNQAPEQVLSRTVHSCTEPNPHSQFECAYHRWTVILIHVAPVRPVQPYCLWRLRCLCYVHLEYYWLVAKAPLAPFSCSPFYHSDVPSNKVNRAESLCCLPDFSDISIPFILSHLTRMPSASSSAGSS